MKWFYFTSVFLVCVIMVRCISPDKIVYQFQEDEFVFEVDTMAWGEKQIIQKQSISLTTFELNEDAEEPLSVYFIFSGITPHIKTFESLTLEVYAKDNSGKLEKIEQSSWKELAASYATGQNIKNVNLNNQAIYKQINWSEVEYTESLKNNSVQFSGTKIFPMNKYPNELVLKIRMKWINKEENFETVIRKTDYKGPKINPKF